MKRILLFLLLFSAVIAHAQFETKSSNFYPSPSKFKINTTQKSYTDDIVANGCVSGNCRNGEGILVEAFADGAVLRAFDTVRIDLNIYKGRFTNDGKNFEGTLYHRIVPFWVEKGKSNTYTPAITYDMKNGDFGDEIASGQMASSDKGFRWSGWMHQKQQPGSGIESQEIFVKLNPEFARTTYTSGSLYKKAQGRIHEAGDMYCGKIDYSDGSTYEGFLYQGKFFGPGRYTNANGDSKEGIWMLDSLTTEMSVSFPREIHEFVEHSSFEAKYESNGWVLQRSGDDIFFGKMTAGKLNGPGMNITLKKADIEGSGWNQWLTYRAGTFIDGELQEGIRVRDYLGWYFSAVKSGRYKNFYRDHSTIISGRFKNDQAAGGCGRKLYLDALGKPTMLIEGSFYPSKNTYEEFADGWLYVNDWAGLRSPDKLRYWYSNHDVLDKDFPYYWLIDAAREANENTFCSPAMQPQSLSILSRITQLGDSMLVVKLRQDAAAEKERKELAEANRKAAENAKACAKSLAEHKISIGTTLFRDGFTGYVKEVDCQNGKITLVKPGQLYLRYDGSEVKQVPLASLSLWIRSDKQYRHCTHCEGMGGEQRTYTTSKTKELPFGYFSGITTTITKTTTEKVWAVCVECSGTGLTLR